MKEAITNEDNLPTELPNTMRRESKNSASSDRTFGTRQAHEPMYHDQTEVHNYNYLYSDVPPSRLTPYSSTHRDWRRPFATLERPVKLDEALELSSARAEHELAQQLRKVVPVRYPLRQLCGGRGGRGVSATASVR